MRYVLGYCERYDFDAELTQNRSENTQKIRKNRIIDDSKILHYFFEELCTQKFKNRQKNTIMKKKKFSLSDCLTEDVKVIDQDLNR